MLSQSMFEMLDVQASELVKFCHVPELSLCLRSAHALLTRSCVESLTR
jgi:hypothetical protein